MLSIANSIAPLILIIIAGMTGGRSGLLPETMRKGLSDFCYYFGMPALLIRTISAAPASTTAPHLIWIAYLVPIAMVWLAGTFLANRREGASIAMASAYGNVIMLGIPLSLLQYGSAAATTVALVVLVHSPILFLAAAVHSEATRANKRTQVGASVGVMNMPPAAPGRMRESFFLAIRETCVDLCTNPIILAILAGVILRFADAGLPPMLDAAFALLAQATLPCVLLSIGLSLSAFKIRGQIGMAGIICVLKLAVLPATTWVFASYALGLPATEVAVITLLSAMPTGANAYVFASRQGSAEAAVSAAVALSTIASAATLTLVLAFVSGSSFTL